MLIKTSELVGPALDWAVAKAVGFELSAPDVERYKIVCYDPAAHGGAPEQGGYPLRYSPATDWAQGGPLIENHMAMLCYPTEAGDPWEASLPGDPDWHFGQTPLIAACRAIVAAKLGETVDVPEGLCHV